MENGKPTKISSRLKQHVFSNGNVKIKGWISVTDLIKIQDSKGRAFVEILPFFEPKEDGTTHLMQEKVYKPGHESSDHGK